MGTWLNAVATCLRDRGWAVTVDEAFLSIEATGAGEQGEAFAAANTECAAAAGPQPNAAPMTVDEIGQQYDYLVQMKACLEAQGYSVSEPTSRTRFIDDYLSGNPPWSPYVDLKGLTPAEWRSVLLACPQDMP